MAFNFDWNSVSSAPELQSFMQGFLSSNTGDVSSQPLSGFLSNEAAYAPQSTAVLGASQYAPSAPYTPEDTEAAWEKAPLQKKYNFMKFLSYDPNLGGYDPQTASTADFFNKYLTPEEQKLVRPKMQNLFGKSQPFSWSPSQQPEMPQRNGSYNFQPTMEYSKDTAGNPIENLFTVRKTGDGLYQLAWRDQHGHYRDLNHKLLPQAFQNDENVRAFPKLPEDWDVAYPEDGNKMHVIDSTGHQYSIEDYLSMFHENPQQQKKQPTAQLTKYSKNSTQLQRQTYKPTNWQDKNIFNVDSPQQDDNGWPLGYKLRMRTIDGYLDPRDDSPLYWINEETGIRYNTKMQPLPLELQHDIDSISLTTPYKGYDIDTEEYVGHQGRKSYRAKYITPDGRRVDGFSRPLRREERHDNLQLVRTRPGSWDDVSNSWAEVRSPHYSTRANPNPANPQLRHGRSFTQNLLTPDNPTAVLGEATQLTPEELNATAPEVKPPPPSEQSQPSFTQNLLTQETPPQRSGTEMVNAAMENAMPQNSAQRRTTPPTSSPYPNAVAVRLQSGLLQAKKAYGDADALEQAINAQVQAALGNAKTDDERAEILRQKNSWDARITATREAAHAQAELLRGIADSAGIDINGYGSDATYNDAYTNLQSRAARDIMAATQGYYSRNSQEYYNDKYIEGLMLGYSPRRARRAAEMHASKYQADRVRFLDGVLNSYGRNGLITNEAGNQIIGALLGEDPNLASFYAQIYPNAKEQFTRQTELENKAIDQGFAVDLSNLGYLQDLGKIAAQTTGNIKLENVRFGNTMKRDAQQQEYTKENAYLAQKYREAQARLETELETGKLTYLAEFESQLKNKEFRNKVAQLETLADYFGFEGDGKKSFVIAGLGIKMPDSKTGKFDDKSIENAKKMFDALSGQEVNILKQLKDGELTLSEEEVESLKSKLAEIRQTKQNLTDKMGEQLGLQAPKSRQDIPNFTGNEEQDVQTVREMLRYMDEQNLNDADKNYYIRQWLPKDRTDRYADYLIKKARGS